MKARIKAKINGITKDKEFVILNFTGINGKVETKMIPAQELNMTGTLMVKEVVGNEIKFGSIITFDISIDDPESL